MLPLPSLPNISNFCHLNNRDHCWAIRIVFEGLNRENELPIFFVAISQKCSPIYGESEPGRHYMHTWFRTG